MSLSAFCCFLSNFWFLYILTVQTLLQLSLQTQCKCLCCNKWEIISYNTAQRLGIIISYSLSNLCYNSTCIILHTLRRIPAASPRDTCGVFWHRHEVKSYIPHDVKWVISETLSPANRLAGTEKTKWKSGEAERNTKAKIAYKHNITPHKLPHSRALRVSYV